MSDAGWEDDDSPGAHFGDDDEGDETGGDDQPDSTGETRTSGEDVGSGTGSTIGTGVDGPTDTNQDPTANPTPIDELDVDREHSPRMLARSMTPVEFRDDPSSRRVPFATWRNGVSHGRDRKTFEIQSEVEALERDVLDRMDDQLGGRPPLTDLREIALVYGLAHWEDLAEMADELGVQFDD